MKKQAKRIAALLLVLVLFVQLSDVMIARAVDAVDAAVNPAERIELYVPASLQGGSYFFIRESTQRISEQSSEKLYIPIQRSGDLSAEAEVTLKVTDMTAHRGVNYEFEVYKEELEPETTLNGIAIIDIVDNAIEQVEEEAPTEEELGEYLEAYGGADVVDTEGNVVGSLTAQRLDGEGNPIPAAAEGEPETTEPEADGAGELPETTEPEPDAAGAASERAEPRANGAGELETQLQGISEAPLEEDDPAGIIAARNRLTGTVSDRQKLSGGDFLDSLSGESPEPVDAKKLVEDSYPGEEYRLHFDPGQEARFVVVTPLYSEEADGDAQIMLFLKDASSGYEFSEDFGPAYISIVDEDERETAVISMASAEITAEEGKASITVTRSGRKNDMVGVHIASWDGTAQQGEDYGGVGANLYFPMGITSRTIELPVGHGAEDKDFYVTLTTLETVPGVEIGAATAHVTIPAGEIVRSTEEDGQLMGLLPDSWLDGALNLQALVSSTYGYSFSFNNGGQGFDASTEADKEGWAAGMYFNAPFGYYYDGLQAKFDLYLCYSDSYVCFNVNPDPGTYYTRYYMFASSKDDDRRTGWEATAFFGSPKYDGKMEIYIKHDDNRSLSRKCYSSMYLKSIRPIKRQFKIVVEQPEALEFKGMTEEEVRREYLGYMANDNLSSNFTLWSGDSFSISATSTYKYAKLVGIEAVRADGSTYRIGTGDGTGSSVSATLDMDTVNALGSKDFIQWSGTNVASETGRLATSYSGTIRVRPVFAYNDVTVNIEPSEFGSLVGERPEPTILWDFNNNDSMKGIMGKTALHQVEYSGGRDSEGNEYYQFTAVNDNPRGGGWSYVDDPYVSFATPAQSAEDIQWVKIRYKNLSQMNSMAIFGYLANNAYDTTRTQIRIETDGKWHEIVFNLRELNRQQMGTSVSVWDEASINWLRLDPLEDTTIDKKIQIDYVAFFPMEESARAFRSSKPALLWDFNSDNAMNSRMGANWRREVSFTGAQTGFDDYYTFTASGGDPFISVETPIYSAADVKWVKIRARNHSSANTLELFASVGSAGKDIGSTKFKIPIDADGQWHEYVAEITNANWKDNIQWLRLDPLDGCRSGDKIDIDYVAFFPTKEEAQAYSGTGGVALQPGRYTYHMGDRLYYTTQMSELGVTAGLKPSGVYHTARQSSTGEIQTLGAKDYINGVLGEPFLVTHYYSSFRPTFTDKDNQMVVRVSDEDLQYFDTSRGLFAGTESWETDGYHFYRVEGNILTNKLYELTAVPTNSVYVPLWTVPGDARTFSGEVFYHRSAATPAENLLTLSVDRTGYRHDWYTLSGTLYSSVWNLSTGMKSDFIMPAADAEVFAGLAGGMTDEEGFFTLPPQYLVGGTTLRYAVSYNGILTLEDVKLSPAGTKKTTVQYMDETGHLASRQAVPLTVNGVEVENWSASGAHFDSVEFKLGGFIPNVIDAVEMNGKTLDVSVHVSAGQSYTYYDSDAEHDGAKAGYVTAQENVTGVTLFFRNPLTGQTHGVYTWDAANVGKEDEKKLNTLKWDASTNTASFHIEKFKPDSPDQYTYGDVLIAVLSTDKKTGGRSVGTTYDPVSTGFTVIADLNYEPEVFDFQFNDLADIFGVTDPGDDPSGLQEETTYSFGRFPYLGEITGAIKVIGFIASASQMSAEAYDAITLMENINVGDGLMSDEGDGEGELMGVASLFSDSLISVAFNMKELTAYNGVRFMFAVVATKGLKGNTANNNPYASKKYMKDLLSPGMTFDNGHTAGTGNDRTKQAAMQSNFGGAYLKFSVYLGFYVDYGFITVTTYKDDGTVEVTGDSLDEMVTDTAVLMGGGGFIGAKLTGGYTWIVMLGPVPAYVNVEANIGVTLFLGVTADPKKTLEARREQDNYTGEDFQFNLEFIGNVGLSVAFGVGLYKVLSVRVGAEAGLEAGYSLRVPKWYPQFDSGVGYTTDITIFGTIDLVVLSIDLWRSSWALPWSAGFMLHTQQARRGQVLMELIDQAIGNPNRGTQEAKAAVKARRDELYQHITDCDLSGEELHELVNSVQDYAKDMGVITRAEYDRVDMLRVGGLGGMIMDAVMFDDEQGIGFRTRPHVDSRWVAGEDGSLMSAFGAVHTERIVQNAIAQPSAQIKAIGGSKYLVVFLDDDNTRDTAQAASLMWTVYDASTDEWTTPAPVQGGLTGDGRPDLVDGGDKLILSWSSVPDAKYTKLKADVAQELAEQGVNGDDYAVQAYLEAHPTRVMKLMEIFSVEFDKGSKSFGPVEQLTDDNYYDDTPQAVYDSQSGDYILYFYKTVQRNSQYAEATELDKLNDLIGSNTDPSKTYSLITYMLHNNQTEAVDTFGNTHEPGWAREYLFPLESSFQYQTDAAGYYVLDDEGDPIPLTKEEKRQQEEQFLAQYGGQRFLSSALRDEDGGYTDAPISDLAVCAGYNDLAVFAFTVDKDMNTDTSEDRELYVQLYSFSDHATYVPVRIAGSQTVSELKRAESTGTYAQVESTQQVTVAQPTLTRNGDSTWLFWREGEDSLKYLNISELLKEKVSETEYAVHDDGTIAEGYQLRIQKMDVSSYLTEDKVTATDYKVVSDEKNNLYVVWTDVMTYTEKDELTGEDVTRTAQEIYASAMIKEEERAAIREKGEEEVSDGVTVPARWSKPYRLTRDNNYNDGIAIALDAKGGLIVVHNQYELLTADTEEEIQMLYNKGMIDLREGSDGKTYVIGSRNYPSEISLAITRFDAVGSVEATGFDISDSTPQAGQTVEVTAVIENTGLTTADGCKVDVYAADQNGALGAAPIASVVYDAPIYVNTARKYTFPWTVPEEGAEGCQLAISVAEKKEDGSYYEASTYYTGVFSAAPEYALSLSDVAQDGDSFRYTYSVVNTGNAPIPAGVTAQVRAAALYGDLQEVYGLDSDVVETMDIGGLEPGASMGAESRVFLPASLFTYCGYDALTLEVLDGNEKVLAATDEVLVVMEQPMNVTVNNGEPVTLRAGDTAEVKTRCNATPFMRRSLSVVYSVADPGIAAVDAQGNLMGLSEGSTTLTATLLPSGRTAEVPVTVYEFYDDEPESVKPTEAETFTVEVSGDEGSANVTAGITDHTANVTAPTEEQLEEIVGKGRETGSVTVDLSGLPESVTAVSIPIETVKAIREALEEGGEGLTLRLPGSSVTFDAEALASIASEAEGEDLTLNVEPIDENTLSGAQREALEGLDVQAVYDIYLSSNNRRITDFGDGRATVEVENRLGSDQKPGGILVWYLAEDGAKQKQPASVTAETVRFIVTHFSNYAVTYDETLPGACGLGEACPLSEFDDLDKTLWYHDGVHWALEQGVMNGVGGGHFEPNTPTSRGMIVTMLYRMEGEPTVSYEPGFVDVETGIWYTEAVRWAAANGIVNGYGDGRFGPKDVLTREQLAAILCRYARYKGVDTSAGEVKPLKDYSDAAEISDWAVRSFRWAVDAGIIKGVGEHVLSPKTEASRAQVAAMLMRYDGL